MLHRIGQLEKIWPHFNLYPLSSIDLLCLAEKRIGIVCLSDSNLSYGFAFRANHRHKAEWCIAYNSNLSETEKILVLGHEIGHHFLTHWNHAPVLGFSKQSLFATEGIEKDASLFGLLSLIPTPTVMQLALANRLDPEALMHRHEWMDTDKAFAYRLCKARVRVFRSYVDALRKRTGLPFHRLESL